MTLELYLRAIICHIFQPRIINMNMSLIGGSMSYDNTPFYLVRIFCKDGWNISIQSNCYNVVYI